MKKIILITLAALLALGLAACGGGPAEPGGTVTETNILPGNEAGNHSYVYEGVAITVGADPGPVLAAMPDQTFEPHEEPSCYVDGATDIQYFYQGLILVVTYPGAADNEPPRVVCIRLVDDTVATPEGLYIGAPEEDIAALYGQADEKNDKFYFYYKGQSSLEIAVNQDGEVDQIIYDYKLE